MQRISDLVSVYTAGRRVRLFRNGRNQAIRIPRDMELPGDEAVIYQQDGRLIIEPVTPASLLALLATWEPIDEEFPEIEDSPPEPVEL
ncbi:MAG: AbrB/MazE/SpoVT family DNA-binding domain-containing protein [Chloroflexi bacterium]|nr:AbrB/MazE/SpoVT family DNA-binding domain-containing protein [Chloroflexota bacterium]